MLRVLGLLAAAATVLTSCLVGDPLPGDTASVFGRPASARDIAYGPEKGCVDERDDAPCGGSHLLDIYSSAAGRSRGTILWVHGGALVAGDKSRLESAGPVFAQLERGWSVVSVNYRLLTERDEPGTTVPPTSSTTTTKVPGSTNTSTTTTAPPEEVDFSPGAELVLAEMTRGASSDASADFDNAYPAALQDVISAAEWVRRNGAKHGLDTSKVVLAGHSSGALLATMVALGWNSDNEVLAGSPRADGWVSMAGPMDLASLDVSRMMWAWLGGNDPKMLADLSPLSMVDADDPPGFVAHGDMDSVVHTYHGRAAEFVYGAIGLSDRLRVDIVDKDSRGRPLPARARWHVPGEGVGMFQFNQFMDGI